MKIAEVVATFPPYHGGMGYVCFHNARELALRGHDVTVFTIDHRRLSYKNDPESFRVVRLKTPLIYGDGGMVPQLYSKLINFDIIHLHYPFFGGAEYVYLASLFRRQKYFLTYHMDVYGNTPFKKLIIGAYEPLLMKKIIRRAVLIGSPGIKYLKKSKVGSFIPWDKVVAFPHAGVDIKKFCPRQKDKSLVQKHKLQGKIIVLFVGNLQPFKGLHILIDAISRIKDESIALLVVGGGYREKTYKRQVKEARLEARVIFAGQKSPDQDLPLYYNLGDFLVLPSTHSESFGLVVLEAMASGKPAIVSSLPGPSQLIENGTDGLIARVSDVNDLKNKIEHLAQERTVREMMGLAARKKVIVKYTWEKIGEQLANIMAIS
ncbi:MAG: glycosyltransferase family 4 protein [Desulfobacteraceae bacterium]|nr:glycosyltransferase family 4 protein [Desulfobacteraceae bacterium]MBC2718255.1 glycosyltransferase family 4 protein [Desulfobacteraceae bacterium]